MTCRSRHYEISSIIQPVLTYFLPQSAPCLSLALDWCCASADPRPLTMILLLLYHICFPAKFATLHFALQLIWPILLIWWFYGYYTLLNFVALWGQPILILHGVSQMMIHARLPCHDEAQATLRVLKSWKLTSKEVYHFICANCCWHASTKVPLFLKQLHPIQEGYLLTAFCDLFQKF
jgi:hypothetical protein